MCIMLLWSVQDMGMYKKLKILISLLFFSIFNISSLMIQWYDIIRQAMMYKTSQNNVTIISSEFCESACNISSGSINCQEIDDTDEELAK